MDLGFYILVAWCLLSAGVVFARFKMRRQATAPIFYLYLVTAILCGLALCLVGAVTTFTGKYPLYGALVAFLAILFNPLALASIFLAPMHLNRATIAFLVCWDAFTLAGMYGTADGCPSYVMMLEGACGLILTLGSVATFILSRTKAQEAG